MVHAEDDIIMYIPGNQLPDFPDFISDAFALAVSARD
jgi:hypothetical protein